jgi:hypothetical protein
VGYARAVIVLLLGLGLSGCYVKSYGLQSEGNGKSATVTSSQVGAAANFSNGRATFTSGQPVSPAAPGGQVAYGRSGALVIAVGLVVAEAVQSVGYWFSAPPPVAARGGSIMDTCSCYAPAKRED